GICNFLINDPFVIINFFITICRCVTHDISIGFVSTFNCTFSIFHTRHMISCNCYFIVLFIFTVICTFHIIWCFTFTLMILMFFFFFFFIIFFFFFSFFFI